MKRLIMCLAVLALVAGVVPMAKASEHDGNRIRFAPSIYMQWPYATWGYLHTADGQHSYLSLGADGFLLRTGDRVKLGGFGIRLAVTDRNFWAASTYPAALRVIRGIYVAPGYAYTFRKQSRPSHGFQVQVLMRLGKEDWD